MVNFDIVPVMDKEHFEECFHRATSFAVWTELNECLQRLVPIAKEDAREIAYDGLYHRPVWGRLNSDGCLEIGLTSQWRARLKEEQGQRAAVAEEEKERLEALAVLDGLRND